MHRTKWEKETIINFNEEEDIADVYTRHKPLMRHMEKVLGIKPYETTSSSRSYKCPKCWIPKPRRPRQLSSDQKAKLRRHLPNCASFIENSPCTVADSNDLDEEVVQNVGLN